MSEARAVEDDHTVPLRGDTHQVAEQEVQTHHHVAMKQDERLSLASFQVVQADIADRRKLARRRIVPLGVAGAFLDDGSGAQRGRSEGNRP
jgi:hypothetical protein